MSDTVLGVGNITVNKTRKCCVGANINKKDLKKYLVCEREVLRKKNKTGKGRRCILGW